MVGIDNFYDLNIPIILSVHRKPFHFIFFDGGQYVDFVTPSKQSFGQRYFEEIRQLAEEFPNGTVRFFGGYHSHLDLKDILQKIHLVIFPSLWEENYPLVVRETLLHGIPVVASKLGGIPEIIIEGLNGYLFDPYAVGDLLGKIVNIFKEPQRLERITQGARTTKIETMEDHVDKIYQLYTQAMQMETRS